MLPNLKLKKVKEFNTLVSKFYFVNWLVVCCHFSKWFNSIRIKI